MERHQDSDIMSPGKTVCSVELRQRASFGSGFFLPNGKPPQWHSSGSGRSEARVAVAALEKRSHSFVQCNKDPITHRIHEDVTGFRPPDVSRQAFKRCEIQTHEQPPSPRRGDFGRSPRLPPLKGEFGPIIIPEIQNRSRS